MYEVEENLIDGALYAVRSHHGKDARVLCGRFAGRHTEGMTVGMARQRKYAHFRPCDDAGHPLPGDDMLVVQLPYAVMYSWGDWLLIRRATTALGLPAEPKMGTLSSRHRWMVGEQDMLRIGRQLRDGDLPTS